MGETVAIANGAAHNEFCGVVGDEEFQDNAGAGLDFVGEEQAHAAAADVGGLAVTGRALAVKEDGDVHGNGDGVALPLACVFTFTRTSAAIPRRHLSATFSHFSRVRNLVTQFVCNDRVVTNRAEERQDDEWASCKALPSRVDHGHLIHSAAGEIKPPIWGRYHVAHGAAAGRNLPGAEGF